MRLCNQIFVKIITLKTSKQTENLQFSYTKKELNLAIVSEVVSYKPGWSIVSSKGSYPKASTFQLSVPHEFTQGFDLILEKKLH